MQVCLRFAGDARLPPQRAALPLGSWADPHSSRRCSSCFAAARGHSCSAAASAACSACRQVCTALNTLRCGRQARARLHQEKGGRQVGRYLV